MSSCNRIAVPLKTDKNVKESETTSIGDIESWPLIQGYSCDSRSTENRASFTRDYKVFRFCNVNYLAQLSEIYLKLQWAFTEIIDQILSKSLAMLEVIIRTVKAQLKEKLAKFNYSNIKIRFNSEGAHEKVDDCVHLATLELSLFDLRDYYNNLNGSVSYADSLLISEIFLNGGNDRISTSVFNMTKHIPAFCCWDSEPKPQLAKPSTKSSAASERKTIPVALLHQGINEVGITAAFCQFNAGSIRISNQRLGYYCFSVASVACFSTDSKEFWGLWQVEVEDIFLERRIRPSPAPFCLTSEDFKGLAKNIFGSNTPPCDTQCILLVLRLGAVSHDALENLRACKVDLDINKRSEVALLSQMDHEARIKVALNGGKGQIFYPSSADEILNFSRNISVEGSTYARNHLESSLCLSAAQKYDQCLSTESLLSRCGIPFSHIDEQKLLLKQKLGIVREPFTYMPKSDSTPSLDRQDEKGSDHLNLDGKEQSNSLQMIIICGFHGSHVVDVAGCIVSIATDSIVWLVLHPKSLMEVSDLLNSSLKQKTEEARSGEKRRFCVLLVAPLWTSVPEVLTQIESFLSPVHNDSKVAPICITSTITCVDPRMCLMGPDGLMLPGLCPFFDRGWVNVIIFTNPTKMNNTVETSRSRLLMQAIRQLNPRAVVLTAPFGRIKNYTQLSLLLNENLFDEEESQRYRLLTYANHGSSLGAYCLKAVSVQFKLPLDRTKWISALKRLRSNLSPFSDEPIIVYAEANLAFDEDPKSGFNCRYWPQIDVLKEAKDGLKGDSGDILPNNVSLYSLTAQFFISQKKTAIRSIYGGDCEEKLKNWLKAWLRECLRYVPALS
ncbi:hypothetical protein TcWFU_004560 [Taenia crassiceps]|uniref:DAAF9 domain-containing protein n=1 Tax=Taenia crassiceps TaxID=6207 RepID=A0ABR4QGU0_9CEST